MGPKPAIVVKQVPGLIPGGFYKYSLAARKQGWGAEKKFFDTALNFTFDITAEVPATGQLALIPQGDTESTRDGQQCVIKTIQIRARLNFAPATAATASDVCHLLLVLDKQCNGAAAAVTDVLTSSNMWSNLNNLANSERFVILKRWAIPMTAQAGVSAAYNDTCKQINLYKKCNIPMKFSGTTGAITEIRSNNIFLIAGSSVSDDLVTLAGICRVRFVG